ncbi:MAG: ATP-binding protein [bacterium]
MFIREFLKKANFKALSIYLLAVGIIILVAQGLHISAGREIIREVNDSQLMIIREIASDLESLMKDLEEKLSTLAKLYPIQRLEADEVLFDLQIYYELLHDKVTHIGIINSQGHYEYFYPPIPQWTQMQEKDFSKMDFFQNALSQLHDNYGQVPFISNRYEQGFGITGIPVSLPLYTNQDGEKGIINAKKIFLGVVVMFLDVDVIDNICQNHYYHLHDYSSFWLIDDQGNLLSHENKAWVGKGIFQVRKNTFAKKRSSQNLDWIIQNRMLKGEAGTMVYFDRSSGPKDEKYYLNYAPVQLSGRKWSIAVTTPAVKMDHWERRVLKSAWQWLLFIISFILVALSFVQVVIILIHKRRINWEKEQKAKFQSAFDGITDLVYMIDVDYNLQIVNKAFIKICGRSEKEVEGRKCFRFIRERETPCADCPIPKTKSTLKTQRLEQIIFQETAYVYAYPLINGEGETTAIVIFARIITKEKMLEQELQRRERLSLLGELAACITHEIKNPLVGIGMLTELVRESVPPGGVIAEDLDRISRECRRLEQLISHLSRFSRPSPLSLEEGDIHKPLDLSLALLRERLKKQGITVQTEYQPTIPPVHHDAQKIQQVFLNLIINSINAMAEGGKLIVRTYLCSAQRGSAQRGGNAQRGNASQASQDARCGFNDNCRGGSQTDSQTVCIDIQDTGIGIPQHLQNRIFDPFFSSSSKGTGLGLSIVHSIIQQHGGHISLKSQPGQGTLITICLPLKPKDASLPLTGTLPDNEHY